MDLRKERTLKYLSQSLVELMGEKPLAQITVSEICDNAMVRRATFYRHFKGKDELLSYVLTQRREAIRERSRGADADMPITKYCEVMVRELAAYVGEHRRDIVRQRLSPEFAAEVQLIVDDIGRDFAFRLAAVEGGGEAGGDGDAGESDGEAVEGGGEADGDGEAGGDGDAGEPDTETRLVANFYAAGLMGAVRWWLNECPDQDDAVLVKALDEVSDKLFC